MLRPAALLLCCALACDDSVATKLAEQHVELTGRVAALESQVGALTGQVTRLAAEVETAAARLDRLEHPPAPASAPKVTVVVTDTGPQIDGQTLDLDKFEAHLRERQAREPGLSLVVESSHAAAYARVVEILERAQRAGVTRIAMATDTAAGSKPAP